MDLLNQKDQNEEFFFTNSALSLLSPRFKNDFDKPMDSNNSCFFMPDPPHCGGRLVQQASQHNNTAQEILMFQEEPGVGQHSIPKIEESAFLNMDDDIMGNVVGPQITLHANQVNMNSSMMGGLLNNHQNENSMFDEDFA